MSTVFTATDINNARLPIGTIVHDKDGDSYQLMADQWWIIGETDVERSRNFNASWQPDDYLPLSEADGPYSIVHQPQDTHTEPAFTHEQLRTLIDAFPDPELFLRSIKFSIGYDSVPHEKVRAHA